MFPLVLQTDFGLDDGAVAAMKGVALTIDPELRIYDLTHGIEPYNIREAGFRLIQSYRYWPENSVFVSVVDPGVGSNRLSVVAKILGKYVVTPDNGTLTYLAEHYGIEELRLLDDSKLRLSGSEESYTFYGRDVYAYTGAMLASGKVAFDEIGEKLDPKDLVMLKLSEPKFNEDGSIEGVIDILDIRYGSLWTNIPKEMFKKIGAGYGDRLRVLIRHDNRPIYNNTMIFEHSFADVEVGEALIYTNSLNCIAIAINQGSFAKAYNIGTGDDWHITILNPREG